MGWPAARMAFKAHGPFLHILAKRVKTDPKKIKTKIPCLNRPRALLSSPAPPHGGLLCVAGWMYVNFEKVHEFEKHSWNIAKQSSKI